MAALLALLFCGAAFSAAAQDHYEVRKIKIKGNKSIDTEDLLDRMALHKSDFVSKKIQKKEPSFYSEQFMESDIERLKSFYQSKGFLNVEVRLDSLELHKKKKQLNICLVIKENAPVKVDSVAVHINDPPEGMRVDVLENKVVPRRLLLKNGAAFEDQTLLDDISRINRVFTNRGYVYVRTDYELNLRHEENLTDISYATTLGPKCQFGETTISGNKYTKEKVIRKQLAYNEGDTYSRDLLDKTRNDLYTLQLFRVASVAPITNKESERNPIPLEIRIEEMPRWMTKFGLGWGTEDKFRAFADVTFRGVFGGTSRMNLYLKHSALTPYYASLSWIEPQFFVKKLSLTVNPYIRRDDEPGYSIQKFGLNLPVGYTINAKMSASLGYYFEKVRQRVEEADADIPNPEDEKFLYNKSGLTASFRYNNAAPVFSPEKGFTASIGGKLNGYIFGGDFDYTKLWLDVRKYQKIATLTIALRGMIGGIYSSDSSGFIPVEDRFYSGGSISNRGWARSMIGPKRESGSPLGGKSILEINVELRHPLFWIIEIAAFMDISNVWEQSYHYPLNDLAYAAGGGLRVNTPIGPIRFDVGAPLWNEKKKVQFFLSVGQAF